MTEHFHDEESRFKALWGPIAFEIRRSDGDMHWYDTPLYREMTEDLREPMTMPSRDFLVRQAVLNALQQHMPSMVRQSGPAAAMRRLVAICGWDHGQPSGWFVRDVIDQFRVLVARYQ